MSAQEDIKASPSFLTTQDANPFFELSGEGLLLLKGKQGEIAKLNSQAKSILNIDNDSNEHRFIHEFADPSTISSLREFIKKALKNEGEVSINSHLIRNKGIRFPCELKAKALSGKDKLIACRLTDQSEKMRYLEEMNLRNTAISSLSSGVSIADARLPDLPLIYVNKGFQELTGYSAREAIGRSCRFLQADDRDQGQLNLLRESLKEGKPCTVRLRNYRKDGSLFHNELHLSPVYDNQRELTHFVGIQIDITEQFEAESRLRQSEYRYRHLANSVTDLILRRTPKGQIEFVSNATKDLLNFDPEELIGKNLFDFIEDEDQQAFFEYNKQVLNNREPDPISIRLRKKTGGVVWMESRDALLASDRESPSILIASILRDVTMRQKAEEEMKQSLEKEKELNQMKSRFISMVSHEFKTPMTGIKASATLLKDYQDTLPQEKKNRHFKNIENALGRMNHMLNEVLFFSRAEADRVRANNEKVDILQLSESIIEKVLLGYPSRDIQIAATDFDLKETHLDPHLLEHALLNLLSNSLKYSAKNKPISLSIENSETFIKFTVRDEGMGIPQADQKNLFKSFHRASNVETIAGTGLGLSITKQAVELMNGKITFSSTEGKGATFVIEIPIASS